MKQESYTLLVVSGDKELTAVLRAASEEVELSIEAAESSADVLVRLKVLGGSISAVVVEVDARSDDRIETLEAIRRIDGKIPIIATSSEPARQLVVSALKSGATDFVCESGSIEAWRRALAGVFSASVAEADGGIAKTSSERRANNSKLAMEFTLSQIACSDVPVLIQGETGTGKEVLARKLHAGSERAKGPFFKLNCAALPSELVESELFGYERGAFTGAFQRKAGIFEAADGGTILLDEIGDMDVRLQAKLLQVLQDQTFQRIGGKDPIRVDVRVIAATHRNLEESIRDGNFREDLFYRLNVVNLVVPTLRERKGELFELFDVLLRRHAKGDELPAPTAELRELMLAWHWPGNVRELENFARRLLIFRDCAYLTRELRERMSRGEAALKGRPHTEKAASVPNQDVSCHIPNLAEVDDARQHAEAETILAALNATRWNRRAAASLLNTDYKCLLYRIKKLGIDHKKPVAIEHAAATGVDGIERVAAAGVC